MTQQDKEALVSRIVALISRELHLASIPHEQKNMMITVFGVPEDMLPSDVRVLYDQNTGQIIAKVCTISDDMSDDACLYSELKLFAAM